MGGASACFEWLRAEADSRRGRVRLEWSTSGADYVLIHGRAFGPHGSVTVRLAPGGRLSLTAQSARPGSAGEIRHVCLGQRMDGPLPRSELPGQRAAGRLRAARRRSRASARSAFRQVISGRGAPRGPRLTQAAARFAAPAPILSVLLSADDRQAAAQEGEERT
jgi:hypothetical protein